MITATGWKLRCDHKGCKTHLGGGADQDALRTRADTAGWQIGVRVDGRPAKRNGKDYCPAHRREDTAVSCVVGAVPEPPMVMHLVELLDSPDPEWRPQGSGEWACARTAHSRGLLDMHLNDERATFSLTDDGRDLARDAKTRHTTDTCHGAGR